MTEDAWAASRAWWRSLDKEQRGVLIQALYETQGEPPLGYPSVPLTDVPTWMKDHRGFGLWMRGEKVGVVTTMHNAGRPIYRFAWQAGGRTGKTTTLEYAKRLVEQVIEDDTP